MTIRRNAAVAAPATTFGARFGMQNLAPQTAEEKQKSEVWANIGYETGDPEYPFVSLPFGIAIDTMSPAQMPRKSDTDYAGFVSAKNRLLEMLQKAAEGLAPGEEMILAPEGSEGGLVIQLRRREADATNEPVPVSERFAPKFQLAMDAAA